MSPGTDEDEVMQKVLEEHRRHPHPGLAGGRLRLHIAVHTVVERQLLENNPSETAVTLARLQAEGMQRHEAVHAIGTVVSEEIIEIMQQQRVYDEARFLARLRALRGAAPGGKKPAE